MQQNKSSDRIDLNKIAQDVMKYRMKKIPDFPDYYATSEGEIWSNKTKKFLKPQTTSRCNYLYVFLRKDNKTYRKAVHHIILETFCEEERNGRECRHLDNNPHNNNLINLKWGTHKENGLDMALSGRQGTAKLNADEVKQIKLLHKESNISFCKLAKMYNVTKGAISHIFNGRTWTHVA